MNSLYTEEQLAHIRNQALVYQCACPAHVSAVIATIRELHKQQVNCLDETDIDREVHERIRESAEKSHAELEACLTDILKIEGWDLETLTMPEDMKKKLLGNK